MKKYVQRVVEAPELYIIAQCGSNDEQLAYTATRLEDLLELKNGINLGELDETYENIVLIDGPATALEAGHQKGGHFFAQAVTSIHA